MSGEYVVVEKRVLEEVLREIAELKRLVQERRSHSTWK
jgi:ACT domain-containing protein